MFRRVAGRAGLAADRPAARVAADDVPVPAHDRVRGDPQPVAAGVRYCVAGDEVVIDDRLVWASAAWSTSRRSWGGTARWTRARAVMSPAPYGAAADRGHFGEFPCGARI
jgi:hypothetical protein